MVQKDEGDSQFPKNFDEDKYKIDPVTSDRLYKFPAPADGFFEDPEEMLNTIKDFTIERGYAIVCERGVTGKSKTLKCDRGTKPNKNKRPGEASATTQSTRLIGCPWKATAYFHKLCNLWKLVVKEPRHNHYPSLYAAAQVESSPQHFFKK
ncbi:hypothetical protein PSTG_11692 [Puccinia striiformis f. sp. tritici PST-78]|uniref:FAR1 domain-containing protein n=1 Tax=Puccinia striiformis f. sp. tritici PST-78 TaxID=1165861 RepID=A0A0L0V7P8_9BASI|nr:hypothetical protein PSTG_11692 [Puccinia striiformis f. sp. tritici PST-78]